MAAMQTNAGCQGKADREQDVPDRFLYERESVSMKKVFFMDWKSFGNEDILDAFAHRGDLNVIRYPFVFLAADAAAQGGNQRADFGR